jgi:hypothetical protein
MVWGNFRLLGGPQALRSLRSLYERCPAQKPRPVHSVAVNRGRSFCNGCPECLNLTRASSQTGRADCKTTKMHKHEPKGCNTNGRRNRLQSARMQTHLTKIASCTALRNCAYFCFAIFQPLFYILGVQFVKATNVCHNFGVQFFGARWARPFYPTHQEKLGKSPPSFLEGIGSTMSGPTLRADRA